MTELFAGNVKVQYGQFYFELTGPFGGAMDDCFRGQSNGLCGAGLPRVLFMMTGLHTGVVGVSVHAFDDDPGIDESWEDIVEVSFQAPDGVIRLVEWASDEHVSLAVPAGSCRARYQGRAMDKASELDTNVDDDPVDRYRLDLWPAPPASDRIVKQTSSVAAEWHAWAGRTTPTS